MSSKLRRQAASLPDKPGIYFFKNPGGEVVYIGKARSLRDRVRSYFIPNPDDKVRMILRETESLDYVLTDSEREAAFLEINYIQQHRPRFNLRLKDDKSFPYLRLTVGERFPSITFSRRVRSDKARYFGPFSPASRARTSIRLVNKYFHVRGCEETIPGKRKRPCLDYDLRLCSAPCVGRITEDRYKGDVANACLFLEGKTRELSRALENRMKEAARAEQFEEAARLRDLLHTVADIKNKPQAISVALEDQDVVGFARTGNEVSVYIFFMRKGKIRNSEEMFFEENSPASDAEILIRHMEAFYAVHDVPGRILLPFSLEKAKGLFPSSRPKEAGPRILTPKSGRNKKLVDLAVKNAKALIKKRTEGMDLLEEAARVLGLDSPPRTIEGIDISNTGGDESVGSLVVFKDGRPDKDNYRKYRIETVQGPNDVASLAEVVRRRYSRLRSEDRPLPDLVIVDGGKGQLSSAQKSLKKTGLGKLPVISIAKGKESIFLPGRKSDLRLEANSPVLKLIQRVRDEAHRFAVSFHRLRRERKSFASRLEGIPGLGPKRKALLLTRYDSIDAIIQTPVEELNSLVGRKAAMHLLERLTRHHPAQKTNNGVPSNGERERKAISSGLSRGKTGRP